MSGPARQSTITVRMQAEICQHPNCCVRTAEASLAADGLDLCVSDLTRDCGEQPLSRFPGRRDRVETYAYEALQTHPCLQSERSSDWLATPLRTRSSLSA